MSHVSSSDLPGLLKLLHTNVTNMSGVNCATAINKLATRFGSTSRSRIKSHKSFRHLVSHVETQSLHDPSFLPARGFANVLHGLAVLGFKSGPLLRRLDERAGMVVSEAGGQELANIAYALGRLGGGTASLGGEEFLRCLDGDYSAVKTLEREGNGQEVSNVVWAFARSGVRCENLPGIFRDPGLMGRLRGDGHAVASAVWSLATIGEDDAARVFIRGTCDTEETRKALTRGGAQSISNAAWGVATVGGERGAFWEVRQKIDHGKVGHLAPKRGSPARN